MGVPLPWLGLSAAITLISGATMGYLARREHSKALWLWACAWFSWAAAAVTLMAVHAPPESSPAFPLCGLFFVGSSLCFLKGTYELVARRMPRAWYFVAGGCIALSLVLALSSTSDRPVAMAPLVSFQCVGLLATGVIALRRRRGQAGALLYGTAMIALSVHLLDAPILASSPHLFLWGFAVALALEVVAALGMVVLYYDNARAQLLEAQRALEHKRRIEALGLVAGGVAHDFNNMLTVMHGHLDLLRDEGADEPSRMLSLSAMEQSLRQAGRLTAQLLTFGKSGEIRKHAVDVREVVENTLALLKQAIPGQIRVTFSCEDGAHVTNGDRTLVEQIVLNLVTNARDAIAEAGLISIDLASADATKSEVLLRVTDSGAGMGPELVSRVFEPFFTTKGPGKGTGLGLTTVQEAVSRLGGRLHVESRPRAGTTFLIFLPRATPPASD